MSAYIVLDGWAGRREIACEIVGETPQRYRVRLLEDGSLPRGRYGHVGDVVVVPKYAVRKEKEHDQ